MNSPLRWIRKEPKHNWPPVEAFKTGNVIIVERANGWINENSERMELTITKVNGRWLYFTRSGSDAVFQAKWDDLDNTYNFVFNIEGFEL